MLLTTIALGVSLLLVPAVPARTTPQPKPDSSPPYSSDVSSREEVKFDFAWRFYLGDLNALIHCSDDAFPRKLDNVQCKGLQKNGANNADDCRDACCADILCAVWQFAEPEGCWIGQSTNCTSHANWVGGGRDVPAIPPPSKTGPTSRDYDDNSWEIVDTPHDAIITGAYSETGPEKHGYLPTNITWYRKHFNLPEDWKGNSIWVYFEGVFRASTIYLNGQYLLYHDSGYTSFSVRLDNATSIFYGDGKQNENIFVVRADATKGSGWWYEGGGIYRHSYLIKTSPVHIAVDSIYGASNVTGSITAHSPSDPTQGMYADTVMFYPRAEVVNDHQIGIGQSVQVRFTLFDVTDEAVGSVSTSILSVSPTHTVAANATMKMSNVQLWSPARTYMYTLQTKVMVAGSSVVDAVNTSIGVRRTLWDPETGFYLNDIHFIWRGFNDHNDFAGVGTAVPDRVNLFRAQSLRAVGGNSWRMSHNPPIPVLLDILDRVGVVVWDENRQFGDSSIWVEDQRNMVKRDRNHPSIMAWSFCNEAGCNRGDEEQAIGQRFKNASYEEDSFRPVTANMNKHVGDGLTNVIDVQGFSHQGGTLFDSFHKQFPKKPLIGSECCSCRTQRGEDVGNSSEKIFGNFNADCNQAQTGNQLNRKFVAGCMVWTLFDYYGEPTPYGWPMVSSSFGSIDLSGFAKASAYWYRAWWLYSAMNNKTTGGKDVPIKPASLINPDAGPSEEDTKNGFLIHIVQHWEPREGNDNRTIQVYTNAPMAELSVNKKSFGVQKLSWQGWAEWRNIPFSPGSVTATALSVDSKQLVTHTVETCGAPAKVVAGVDVPSDKTGTGTALLLDGQDAGMVHAAVVDAAGHVVVSSNHNVTFQVISGPGRIIGVGNGNPSCHEPNQVPWRSAYHGLAHAIVQVTEDRATSAQHRHRLLQIDKDGGGRTRIVPFGYSETAAEEIVVEASVAGLGSSRVSIPVSDDAETHSVLSVAKKWMTK